MGLSNKPTIEYTKKKEKKGKEKKENRLIYRKKIKN